VDSIGAGIRDPIAKTDVVRAMCIAGAGADPQLAFDSSTLAGLPPPENGKSQNGARRRMTGFIAEPIVYPAGKLTLPPSDVIATGSLARNGRPRGIFLEPGQELTVESERIWCAHDPLVRGA
jgi:2-keto-4-pentenoate hydratase/2-oxohepta-3-ene-1,7-dioic acid hydratase in catechol pathway